MLAARAHGCHTAAVLAPSMLVVHAMLAHAFGGWWFLASAVSIQREESFVCFAVSQGDCHVAALNQSTRDSYS